MPEGRLNRRWRLAVVGVALATAIGGAWRGWEGANPDPHQSADERAYTHLARDLSRSFQYGDHQLRDAVHWPPGAPLAFSLADRIHHGHSRLGHNDIPTAYAFQAFFSTAQVPMAAAIAAMAGGPVAAVVAATVVALYPPLARAPADLLAEPLGGMLLCAALLALCWAIRRRSPWRAGLAGLLLGFALLTRADLTLLPFVLCAVTLGLLWRPGGPRLAALGAAALLAGTLVPTVPWTIYASGRDGTFVPIASGGGSNLFIGTYLPGDGTIFGLKEHFAAETKRRFPALRQVHPANLPQKYVLGAIARAPRGPKTDAVLRRKAFSQLGRAIVHQPGALLAMMGRKVWRLWGDYTIGGRQLHESWLRGVHLVLLGLALIGLLAGLFLRAGPEGAIALALFLTASLVNSVLVSEPRHGLTSLPVLFAAGAAGWTLLAGRAASRSRSSATSPSSAPPS
jgi:hypothetical protein